MTSKKPLTHFYLLALSIGLVYLWFGALKFFPNLSPAEEIARNTISKLTFHLIPADYLLLLLAVWEFLVGILLILNIWRKQVVLVALVHMFCTFSPLILFPELVFGTVLFQLSLLGQYIFKNLVIIAGLVVLYKTTTK